ncbi:MAG: T9SS type A sorting domain-containing protein [Candidatus Cloacimonetes bacterium]|nr:T9SS type A sorting domain-containing protein [Candidatus Cloacimonadota bacterium]
MKQSIFLYLFFSLWLFCLADPDWEPVIYTNSTVAYSRVTIDELSAVPGDIVAAFVEGECRGVGDVIIDEGEAYCTMNIQGNIAEQVSFLVWDQSIDTTCSVEYTTMTDPGYDIGYPPDFLPIEAYSGNPINHYPVMNLPDSFVIPEDIPTTYDFADYCSDEDNDPLTVTGENSEHIYVSGNGLIVTLSSAENWVGFEYVTLWLSDGSLFVHDSVEVYVTAVNDPPEITDTYPATGAIEVEQNNPVSFAVMAQDIDSAINYTWYLDDAVQSSTDYIFNYTFTELSTYQVRCLVSDGFYEVEALWQVTVNIEPVNENSLTNYLLITPNPCSENLTIQGLLLRTENCQLALYDLRGRKVMQLNSTRTGKITAPVSHLPAGIYFLNLTSPDRNITRKVTISR